MYTEFRVTTGPRLHDPASDHGGELGLLVLVRGTLFKSNSPETFSITMNTVVQYSYMPGLRGIQRD